MFANGPHYPTPPYTIVDKLAFVHFSKCVLTTYFAACAKCRLIALWSQPAKAKQMGNR